MHIMVDTNDDTKVVRHVEVTRVVRRRRWSHEEKGRVVAEAVAPGAVIADVARRHDGTIWLPSTCPIGSARRRTADLHCQPIPSCR